MGIIALGAGVAVLTGAGAGIGIGLATAKATESIARQPEAKGDIRTALLLGCALAEATAIYGFVIALLIILIECLILVSGAFSGQFSTLSCCSYCSGYSFSNL